jgi:predicted acylesterase/phospholipase RssA
MRFDLLMSSGFLCFSSHCGMLRALEEVGMQPDAYVGTSSGALAAAMAAAGLSADEVAAQLSEQQPIRLCRPTRPTLDGFMSTRALVRKLRTVLPPTFDDLPRPCAVGVYEHQLYRDRTKSRGKRRPVLVTSGDLPLAVAASCAVPRLFKPLPLEARGIVPGAVGMCDLQPRGTPTFYADGGAVDRTFHQSWNAWRPNSQGLVHLISDLPEGKHGPRDGVHASSDGVLHIVRTPRARANFFSLQDFQSQVAHAAEVARISLERLET